MSASESGEVVSATGAREIPDVGAMWRALKENFLPYTKRQLFIFVVLFWNSQIFTVTVSNPVAIKYVQELFYVFLFVFSILYLFLQSFRNSIRKTDFLVFFLVMFGLLYSPAAAWFRFGQPVLYGVIEERRILAFLVYFPVVWAFRNNVVSMSKLLNWIIFYALLCAMLSIGVVAGIVPEINKVTASTSEGLREERYGIGTWYISFAAMVIFFRMTRRNFMSHLTMFLFFAVVLLAIVQTRQVLISLAIALLIMRGTYILKAFLLPFVVLLYFGVQWVPKLSDMWDKFTSLFAQIATNQYLTQSARAIDIITIYHEFMKGAWLGSGSLYNKWHGGFSHIYYSLFYLTDVGVFGSVYKFGVIAVPFYLIYLIRQYGILRAVKSHPYYRLILAMWVQVLVTMPVGAPIEYRGFLTAFVLALSVGCLYEPEGAGRT